MQFLQILISNHWHLILSNLISFFLLLTPIKAINLSTKSLGKSRAKYIYHNKDIIT